MNYLFLIGAVLAGSLQGQQAEIKLEQPFTAPAKTTEPEPVQSKHSLVPSTKKVSLKKMSAAEMKAHAEQLQASAKLIFAAFRHDKQAMETALKEGADINVRAEKDGVTALMLQMKDPQYLPLVELLVQQPGINLNMVDDAGQTALHHAAFYGNEKALILLLRKGALVGVPDYQGSTPLLVAAATRNLETIVPLLEAGSDPYFENDAKSSFAHMAILNPQWRKNEVVRKALHLNSEDQESGSSCIIS